MVETTISLIPLLVKPIWITNV